MIDERETAVPRQELLPEFNWLERRADGMVVMLFVTLPLADFAIFWFHLGWGWVLTVLAAGLVLGCLLGMPLGDHLGRGYVGGMFLPRWARSLFLSWVLLSLAGWPGFYLAHSKTPGPPPTRITPSRGGDRSP